MMMMLDDIDRCDSRFGLSHRWEVISTYTEICVGLL